MNVQYQHLYGPLTPVRSDPLSIDSGIIPEHPSTTSHPPSTTRSDPGAQSRNLVLRTQPRARPEHSQVYPKIETKNILKILKLVLFIVLESQPEIFRGYLSLCT